MSWLFIILSLSLTFNNLSEARHQNRFPSAVVVGTVYCDTCLQEEFSKSSHFISGASIAVECKDENARRSFRREVKTDEHGEFKVELPFSVNKHVKKIKICSVKLLSSSEPDCAVASTETSSSLHLKSRKQGTHIFSAGFFTFKPQKQPNLCNQKPSIHDSRELNPKKTSISSLEDPTSELPPLNQNYFYPLPFLPQLPPLPKLPSLPPLPALPSLPTFPGNSSKITQSLSNVKASHPDHIFPSDFPPNPFQPPSILPPNPFQPPPSLLPPNPLQPPPSPLIPFPPIPGLTPPPQPSFPSPLPPFPSLPSPPGFPGIPPAAASQEPSP